MAAAAAALSSIASCSSSCSSSSSPFATSASGIKPLPSLPARRRPLRLPTRPRRSVWTVGSVAADDLDVIPVNSADPTDLPPSMNSEESEGGAATASVSVSSSSSVGGFAFDSGAVGFASSASSIDAPLDGGKGGGGGGGGEEKVADRAINATIVLAAGTYAITKLLTIDHDYWQGWTVFEILRYAPQHNWTAYEEALKTNPVLAKMMISGIVYSLGDWIAQCIEGKPLFEFDRTRMLRSGLVGFTLHGSLSHYYYHLCEDLFPFDDWWVVPAKVAFDQTVWAAIWNSIYFVILGFMRLESPISIYTELKATFWPMLTAGWKLWPFAHLITYGVVPVEQRLLWVDCVELLWVTILSTLSNEKSGARISEASSENNS